MKRRSRSKHIEARRRSIVFAPASADDVIGLLLAWRFWLLAGLAGAVLGGALYTLAPPPFRASATVNVDFHLEQAWPQNTDREQFYYLERETRKLIEIAMSDSTFGAVATSVPNVSMEYLRSGVLHLSQPGSGGWHFHADDKNPDRAVLLAGSWARAFADEVEREVILGSPGGLEPYITVDVTQSESIVPDRAVTLGLFLLIGAGAALLLSSLAILLFRFR